LKYYPKIKFDVKIYVKGEEKIIVGDVVSLEMNFERLNNLFNGLA